MLSEGRGEEIRRLLTSGDYLTMQPNELWNLITELLAAESTLTRQYSSLIQAVLLEVDSDTAERIRHRARAIEAESQE